MLAHRGLSRRERYNAKLPEVSYLPVELCVVNFLFESNLGFLIRAAGCFGVKVINIIGDCPPRSVLNPISGSLYDYIELRKYSTPNEFLRSVRERKIPLISAEISENSTPINSVNFNSFGNFCLVVGNEETGVPTEILRHSLPVYVPMPGIGYCLNTSQAANVILYEITRQVQCEDEKRE